MHQLVAVQLDIAWEDRAANHQRVRTLLEGAQLTRGAIVALPEMFASGFSMNVDAIAEDASRPTERFLCDTARDLGIYLVGGLVTRGTDGRGRNHAIIAGPDGSVVARYQKIHPFTLGRESSHYSGGNAIATAPIGDLTVAPLVCYDLRFPELFRGAMQRGANVMVVIANWPSPRIEHWVTLLRARAIENQAYVLGVNRCGDDPNLPYPGRSMIVDFRGDILVDAGDGESVVSGATDLPALQAYRREFPFLGDTKIDLAAQFG